MAQLNIFFMVSARQEDQRLSEQRIAELAQFIQTSFQHNLSGADVVIKHAFLEDSHALIGQIYIRDVSWPHFFQAVRHTKGAVEETGVSVDQFCSRG